MRRLYTRRLRPALLSVIFLAMGGLSCQKPQVAEKRELLSLRLEHKPVHEHIGPGGQQIRAKIISSPELEEGEAKIFYRKGRDDFISLPMTLTGQENEYVAVIPHQPRGTTVRYYIQASSITGTQVTLPKDALETGESYELTFKGRASLALLGLHVGGMIGGLLLLLLAGYWASLFLRKGERLNALAKAAFGGTVFFFLGGIPLGIAVEYQVYGTVWTGIPVGTDVTDSKTLILVLYWIGVLLLFKGTLFQRGEGKNLVSDRTFAWAVLIGAILTVIAFLIPH
ncbi:MAG: hypothetical protein ACE5OR_00700 [bacterium]